MDLRHIKAPIILLLVCTGILLADNTSDNILQNGSFETPSIGVQTMPDKWMTRRMSRQDTGLLITDSGNAHYGCRYMQLASSAGAGIRLDALQGRQKIQLMPGQEYTVSAWARLEPQATSSCMTIEPGNGQFELTSEWQEYSFDYHFPESAEPEVGFFVRIVGGPAAIDDVSIVPADRGVNWPRELTADRAAIKNVEPDPAWTANEWSSRIPIRIREVMGEDAIRVPIKLKLCNIMSYLGYNRLSKGNFQVVDPGAGNRHVPWALMDADRFEGTSCDDEVVFLSNCPAGTAKTYYIYFEPNPGRGEEKPLKNLPGILAIPPDYDYELDVEIGPIQRKNTISCDYNCDTVVATITAYAAEDVTAVIISPDQTIQIAIEPGKTSDFTWRGSVALPQDLPAGVWKLQAETRDATGKRSREITSFVVGSAMWWSNGLSRIMPDEKPRYGGDYVQICAARNEKESFFIAVQSNRDLKNVQLKGTDLKSKRGYSIRSDRITFELVENVYIKTMHRYGRAGWYPDPLISWLKRDIGANQHKTANVTIGIDADVPAGKYRGRIIASADNEDDIMIPVVLEVFNFTLPDERALKPILGGDVWIKPTLGYHAASEGTDYYRDISTPKAVLALAKILADNCATPFYYHHDKSPYAIIWHYDPEKDEAEFDFSQFDKYATLMLEEWGQACLFLGGKFAGGWRNPGNVWDWNRDIQKARSAYWEEAYPEHIYSLRTDEGMRVYHTYWKGVARHLEEKGWLDKAYVYLTDEDKSDEVREVVLKKAETIRKAHPGLRTFVASNASYRWADYMEHVDAFTGHISEENMAKLKKRNGQWWGEYNAIGMTPYPIAFSRAIGAKHWFAGTDVYFNWAACRVPDAWVDTEQYYYVKANAGYEYLEFIKDYTIWGNLGTIIYPVPAREPRPDDEYNDMFVSSIRLQAIREAVEDYEYLNIASKLTGGDSVDAQGFTPTESAMSKLQRLLGQSRRRIMKFNYYDLDPDEYYQARRELGIAIGQADQ